MGADTFSAPTTAGKRQAKRARVLLAAKLQTPVGEIDCRLRDLSRKGALVECNVMPPVGSQVVFVRGSTVVPARVAWTGPGKVGLEFLYMIDEAEVLVQLNKSGGNGNNQRFRRPGLNENLSDQERKLARAWGVQVGINLPDTEG